MLSPRTYVADLAAPDQVIQSAHSLLDRSIRVGSMALCGAGRSALARVGNMGAHLQ